MAVVRSMRRRAVRAERGRRAGPAGGARVGDRRRLQPGRPDQDRDRGQRAGAQHRASTAAAARSRLEALNDGARRGLRLVFEDQGPGIADIEQALRDGYTTRRRPRARPRRRAAARQRVRRSTRARAQGTRVTHHAMEVSRAAPLLEIARCQRRRSTRAARPRIWRSGLGFSAEADAVGWRIVVTEAATNLVKHGGGGELLLRTLGADGDARGRACSPSTVGPGFANLAAACATATRRAARPAPGSARSAGSSTLFDIYSRPGAGTAALMATLWPGTPPARAAGSDREWRRRGRTRRGACAATPGRSGAATGRARRPGRRRARSRAAARPARLGSRGRRLPRSGQRSGRPRSSSASTTACARRAAPPSRSPRSTARTASSASRRRQHRRDDPGRRSRPGAWSPTTAPLGHDVRRIQEFTYPWPTGALLVLHSDGLISHWALDRYPGLAARAPDADRRGPVPRLPPRPRRRDGGRAAGGVVMPAAPVAWRSATSTTWCSRASARARSRPLLGFDAQDQTRIATAVSEIARNAFQYARGGKVEFRLEGVTRPQVLAVGVTRPGPGHRGPGRRPRRPLPLAAPAWGSGIVGARRLMDRFDDRSRARASGTTVVLQQACCRAARRLVGADAVARLTERARAPGAAATRSTRCSEQNQELLRALEELGRRQEELARAQPRARGHQPRRGRALRRARREGGPPAPRRRAQVALPLEHEPRVPHAAELDPGAGPHPARPHRRRPDRRAGAAGHASSARRPTRSPSW